MRAFARISTSSSKGFTRSNTYADYLKAKDKLVLEIKSIVDEAGGAFAFPSRSIYVEAQPGTSPEGFAAVPTDKGT